jgi:hypothetical protein
LQAPVPFVPGQIEGSFGKEEILRVRSLSRKIVVVAGLLAQAPGTDSASLLPLSHEEDPRLVRLREFFVKYDSPAHTLAADFLAAADGYGLDWRLLPAIALIESGGGRDCRGNNIFGWDSGRKGFPTIRAGIHTVAQRLAESKLYRDKDLTGILRTYNTSAQYTRKALSLMEKLGPAEFPAGGYLN